MNPNETLQNKRIELRTRDGHKICDVDVPLFLPPNYIVLWKERAFQQMPAGHPMAGQWIESELYTVRPD